MLGRGGTAAVWAGVDTRLSRPVAVKVVDGAARADPAMVQRLDREARTVARLAHPNIVAVYDVGTEGGVPFLVMELVEGTSLQHRLAHGPMDVREAVGIAAQICDALEAAHDAGVVHRDIKPDNVLLTRTGAVKVCDFGIARLQQASQVHLTGSATVVGTSEYMAPEQATGGPVDARTDLYALGAVLYAMLTGGPPFSGDNPMQVLWQQVHEPPAPVGSHRSGIPADLEALVTRLLAKNPADRPYLAGQVRARLARLPGLSDARVWASGAAVAAELPPPAAHARAAVVTPTQTMPPIDASREESPTKAGIRLGPAGIAAVAAGAAAVTALVIALFIAATPAEQAASPANSGTRGASTPATATTAAAPTNVNAVRAAIQAQVQAGQLDARGANDLVDRLDDVDRNLARGRPDDAAQKLEDVRDRLNELRDDGKITNAGYSAILAALDQLANALPSAGNNNNGHN
jgi:serine/threonine-protein kinase